MSETNRSRRSFLGRALAAAGAFAVGGVGVLLGNTAEARRNGFRPPGRPIYQPKYGGRPDPIFRPKYGGNPSKPPPVYKPKYGGNPIKPPPVYKPKYGGNPSKPPPVYKPKYGGNPIKPPPVYQPKYGGRPGLIRPRPVVRRRGFLISIWRKR